MIRCISHFILISFVAVYRYLCLVVVNELDSDDIFALLRHHASNVSPLTINLSKAPNLVCNPTILLALGVAQNDIAVQAFLSPALLQEVVFGDICDLDVPIFHGQQRLMSELKERPTCSIP